VKALAPTGINRQLISQRHFINLTVRQVSPICLSGFCHSVQLMAAFLYWLLVSHIMLNYKKIASAAKIQWWAPILKMV